jgi:Predicted redox protein, regulator of disulfide bond formation
MCPIPLLKLTEQMTIIENGEEVLIITDHSCTLEYLKEFCNTKTLKIVYDEVFNGVW